MPTPNTREYLVNALNRLAPDQRNRTVISDIMEELQGVVDLTSSAKQIEWDEVDITAATSGTPTFTIPAPTIQAVTCYRHIFLDGIILPSVNQDWSIQVRYPGFSQPYTVVRVDIKEAQAHDLLAMNNQGGVGSVQKFSQPLYVFPSGILTVVRGAEALTTAQYRCAYVREILGGPFSAQLEADMTGAFV